MLTDCCFRNLFAKLQHFIQDAKTYIRFFQNQLTTQTLH